MATGGTEVFLSCDARSPSVHQGSSPAPRDVVDVGLAALIATLFGVEALRAFLTGVYALNVLTTGLNVSVGAVLLLLAPVVHMLGLGRVAPARLVPPIAILLAGFRLLLLVPWPLALHVLFSGLATATYLVFVVPFLAGALRLAGGAGGVASGIGFALAADLALRILGASTDPGATLWSAAYLAPLTLVFLLVAFRVPLPREPMTNRGPPLRAVALGLGLGGFLALATTALLYPWFLARWTGQSPGPFGPSVLLGFAAGAYVARAGLGPPARAARWNAVLLAALAVFAIDLALVGTDVLPVSALLAAAASVVGLERLLGSATRSGMSARDMGLALTIASAVLLLAVLAFVFTLTYAYVPAPAVWKGHAPVVLLLIAVAFLGPALAAGKRGTGVAPSSLGRRSAAVVAAVVLTLGAVGIALTPSVAPVAPGTDVLRVMTFNVHQGFGADGLLDVSRIADVVRLANPDVLALQESDTVRLTSGGVDLVGYLSASLGYHVAYGPPTREQTYGVAVLSRLPIVTWSYALLTSAGDQRALVHATLQSAFGSIHVIAVHLGLRQADRDVQVSEVLAYLDRVAGSRILLGDLNACPSGSCPADIDPPDAVYGRLSAALDDAWVEAGFDPEADSGFTYPSTHPVERIDYIFVSAGVAILRCEVVGPPSRTDASDHLPVLAEVRVS